MKRRKFLKIAGSSSVILGVGSYGLFLGTRTPNAALLPWKNAGKLYNDPVRNALSYAILAPNPHNRQPWIVDLKSETEAVLSCDLQRLLPVTDPFSRQIVIGLGAFLELFSIAATQSGYQAEITLFPQGEPGDALNQKPVARLKLNEDAQIKTDPLFQHVLSRHTNREPYDTKKTINSQKLQFISDAARSDVQTGYVAEGLQLEELRTLTQKALIGEILDAPAFQESIDLIRIGRREVEASPDGISLTGGFMETLKLLGILSREELADPSSKSFQIGLEMADKQALSAMGFVWITTAGNGRREQIAAGRSYMRVALETNKQGLFMQPMSQALQEYQAMRPYYLEVHKMLTQKPDERVQMLARLGYAEPEAQSPRWGLSSRIKSG